MIEYSIEKERARLKAELDRQEVNLLKRTLKLDVNPKEFAFLIKAHCSLIMIKQNNQNYFRLDNVKDVLNQLYYYATQDKRFEGSFDKGILLIGKYGVGKTLILSAFCNLITAITYRNIEIIHSKQLVTMVTSNPDLIYDKYSVLGLMIDDLGKEPYNVTSFGTQTMPIEDVLSARYDKRSITFATANLKLNDFKYSQSIKERMSEMFNIILLKGDSMRK